MGTLATVEWQMEVQPSLVACLKQRSVQGTVLEGACLVPEWYVTSYFSSVLVLDIDTDLTPFSPDTKLE